MKAATRIRAMALLTCVGTAGSAEAEEIRVYCSGAPSQAVRTIGADFSAQSGHYLTFVVAQPATIEADLSAGDQADLVILPAATIAALKAAGALTADSAVDVARVGIGVVVRAGARRPDISSSAAIRQLLLNARSVVYPDPATGGGSAGRAIAQMIDRMGITEAVRPKLTLAAAIGGGVDLVAAGKAEIGFFNISEILPIRGVDLVGPLPAELQSYIVFDAAIATAAAAPQPAQAFIKMLTAPSERQAWQKAGLEPLGAQ
jgi:molybdate transport system substrate-binding protein